MAGRYRLYIDESGDGEVTSVHDPRYRYLGLTGLIIPPEQHDDELTTDLDNLKRKHFPSHLEHTVILVRSEIVRATGPFYLLQDPNANQAWERDAMIFMETWATHPVTVVIDKQQTQQQYGDRDEDPYLRAMRFMVERYNGWLHTNESVGDVLIEGRGAAEDRRLKAAYEYLYEHGTGYRPAQELQEVLTSRELKIDLKKRNIAGLQLADLLANPARRSILQEFRGHDLLPGSFTQRVIEMLRPRYHRANRVIFPR